MSKPLDLSPLSRVPHSANSDARALLLESTRGVADLSLRAAALQAAHGGHRLTDVLAGDRVASNSFPREGLPSLAERGLPPDARHANHAFTLAARRRALAWRLARSAAEDGLVGRGR